jgi:MIP family channel proteins
MQKRDLPSVCAAEFVGTFALVFVGGGAIIAAHDAGGAGLLAVAVAHGLILALMVSATMSISGLLNPALTIGLLAVRRITPRAAGFCIVAQLLGASIAALALKELVPADQFAAAHGTIQEIAPGVSLGQALVLEGIATFFLMFMVFGTAIDPEGPKVGGFAIGLTIGADILAIGPLTGGSMNPARSFGPALISHNFVGQFVYWVGPIGGAIVAAILYDWMLARRGVPKPDPVQV